MKDDPQAAGAALRRVQPALNTPVVSIDELLVGPAAACIAVYGPPERLSLVLALRSVRSGQVAFFSPESPGALADVDLAIDAATGFAEAMGFLFDEALVAGTDEPRVLSRVWHTFLAEPEPECLEQDAAPVFETVQAPLLLSKFRFERVRSARLGHQAVPQASDAARS